MATDSYDELEHRALQLPAHDQHKLLQALRGSGGAEFEELVQQHMATGKYSSEDELLREALEALAEEEEDLDAVRQAIAELEAGDQGVGIDEAVDAIRRAQKRFLSRRQIEEAAEPDE